MEFTSNWASEYATTGGQKYGLQGTQNTDIPMVQANIKKGIWPANNWQNSMSISYIDLKRLADARINGIPAPYSLQELLDEGVKVNWGKALDFVTYLGWLGQPGLVNNPNIASVEAAASGSGPNPTQWASKTTVEILNDVNYALLYTQEHSGYDLEGMADTILMDYEHWSILNQPMTTGGFNSVLEYILANNVARRQGIDLEILPLADDWISAQGYAGDEHAARLPQEREILAASDPATHPEDHDRAKREHGRKLPDDFQRLHRRCAVATPHDCALSLGHLNFAL